MYRVQQSEVNPWQGYVESSREKQTHGKVIENHVESSRAMLELCRVKQTEVDPWQTYVESSTVKQSHGRVMQSQVKTWQIGVQ